MENPVFPNYRAKHLERSLIDPALYIEYLKSRGSFPTIPPPQGIIVCYSPKLMKHVTANFACRPADGFLTNLQLLDSTGGSVGIIGDFGIGAPMAAVVLADHSPKSEGYFLYFPKRTQMMPKLRAFVDFMRQAK